MIDSATIDLATIDLAALYFLSTIPEEMPVIQCENKSLNHGSIRHSSSSGNSKVMACLFSLGLSTLLVFLLWQMFKEEPESDSLEEEKVETPVSPKAALVDFVHDLLGIKI